MILDISDVLLEAGLSSSATEEERAIAAVAVKRAESAVIRHLRYNPEQAERTEFYPAQDFDYQGRGAVWEIEGSRAVIRRIAEASTDELQLRHMPLRRQNAAGTATVPQVWIDLDGRSGTSTNAFDSGTQKTEGSDFWANYDMHDSAGALVARDSILRSVGRWPTTPNTVKVVYTAGYTSDELRGVDSIINAMPIWESCMIEAVVRLRQAMLNKKTNRGWLSGPIISENLGDYSYSLASGVTEKLFGYQNNLTRESSFRLEEFVNFGAMIAS